MRFPVEKYNIVIHQHKDYGSIEIIAWSTYAGRPVYGKAICRDGDTYSEETGIRLAVARCANKIAKKRKARATKLLDNAAKQLAAAQKYVDDMNHYLKDASNEVTETESEIADILSKL